MAEARIPVDLRNPGQVFACLGLMEAAEILLGPCEGGFEGDAGATGGQFALDASGDANPVGTAITFLARATAIARAPFGSGLAAETGILTEAAETCPAPPPDAPATLAVILRDDTREIPIEHWSDGAHNGRDNVKFWAGAGGYSGAALSRDALAAARPALDTTPGLAAAVADPFALAAPMSSSFRFDWRRDYIPLDAGTSLNAHGAITPQGFPLVELLAAIGLQHARPVRVTPTDKLAYRYAAWTVPLPTVLARAALGGAGFGFPVRRFTMRLGWPGKKDQARAIIDATEDPA